ncbi:MAG: ATP-binding protein [Cyanobacteriota bacterium]|nr:ATP-binding protein [Cyanobacteriota bacterium]
MLICHFLIGPPASGKSTLASELAALTKGCIVSTDRVREQLFGDEIIQGDWSAIQREVISQMGEAIAAGQSIIYDATNAKREWREDLLETVARELEAKQLQWIAWYVTTSIEKCKEWNQKRSRKVPEEVIEAMFASLKQVPPSAEEGFLAVVPVVATQLDRQKLEQQIRKVIRS